MIEPVTKLEGWKWAAAQGLGLADCSLAIPTYGRPKVVVQLLETLSKLPDYPDEIVVVDGSPNSDTRTAISKWREQTPAPFRLTYVQSPPGLTLQRNVGIDVSEGEFIYFLDDDCLPLPGYFRSIRQVFADDKHRTVGGVRGVFTNSYGQPLPPIWKLRIALGLVEAEPRGKYFSIGCSNSWNSFKPFQGSRPVDVLAGGAAAYRRQVFARYRFSEFFHGYAQGEDLEFSRRIASEWELRVCGDAMVNHNHAEGGRPAGYRRGRMMMRNRYYIWKRYTDPLTSIDRVRFWIDHILIMGFSMVSGLRRLSPAGFSYALGIGLAGLECIVRPPQHEEKPARREYALSEARPPTETAMEQTRWTTSARPATTADVVESAM